MTSGLFGEITLTLGGGMPRAGEIKESFEETTARIQEPSVGRGLRMESETKYRWIASPGEDLRVRIFTENIPATDKVRLTVWDWRPVPVMIKEFKTPVNEWIRFKFSGDGVFLILLDAFDDQGVWKSRLVRSVASLTDHRDSIKVWQKQNNYFVGSCFFPVRIGKWTNWGWPDLSTDEAIGKCVDLAARAGLQVLRLDFDRDRPFDFSALDSIVETVTNRGLTVNFKIPARPEFCHGISNEQWVKAVYELAKKHGPSATLFEIGNEPAFANYFSGTREEYQQLLFQGYGAIKKANPSNRVVNGGMCHPDVAAGGTGSRRSNFYTNFYREAGASNDYLAYHFHEKLTNNEWIYWMGEQMRANGHGKVPLVQTEGGRAVWRLDRDALSGSELMQKIFWSWSRGDVGWMQYNLIEAGVGGSNALWGGDRREWGLFEESLFAPRFLYGTLSSFHGHFAGYRKTGVISGDELPERDVYYCTFTNTNKILLAYWSVRDSGAKIRVAHGGSGATSFDEMGNTLGVLPKKSFEVECSVYPRWLRFEKWADPKVTRISSRP